MKYLKEGLEEILKNHLKWRNCENGGCRANLRGADLRGADLCGADLRGADLRDANLRDADLCDADLDYSCLTFACKTLYAKFSEKIITQILYHAAMPTQNNEIELSDDAKILLNSEAFKNVVNKFHLVSECGRYTGVKNEKD